MVSTDPQPGIRISRNNEGDIMLNLLSAAAPMVKTLFNTIDKTIDNKAEAEKIKQSIQEQLITGQLKELEAQAKVITTEANGSWLQRNWRPILMLVFAGLVVAHWFGFTAPNIPESVQNSLLNIVLVGVGGYIVGRSGEKIADKFKKE
mgnify:CR=1 FL=1